MRTHTNNLLALGSTGEDPRVTAPTPDRRGHPAQDSRRSRPSCAPRSSPVPTVAVQPLGERGIPRGVERALAEAPR
jgi:hypothetical protein